MRAELPLIAAARHLRPPDAEYDSAGTVLWLDGDVQLGLLGRSDARSAYSLSGCVSRVSSSSGTPFGIRTMICS